jgi:hypothetical protein
VPARSRPCSGTKLAFALLALIPAVIVSIVILSVIISNILIARGVTAIIVVNVFALIIGSAFHAVVVFESRFLTLINCQSVNPVMPDDATALRVAGDARCSRACEDHECIVTKEVATESRVGCPASLVNALRRLELHLACN